MAWPWMAETPTPRRCFRPHQPCAEILMLGGNPPPLATGGQGHRPFPAGCAHSCSFLGEPAPTQTACGRSSRAHPTRPWGGLRRQWAHLPGKAQLHLGPSLTMQGTADSQLLDLLSWSQPHRSMAAWRLSSYLACLGPQIIGPSSLC